MGESFPLHCTANGKAFLASMPPQDLARVLAGSLVALTPRTITDPAALALELERIRADGIAYDREEHAEGICAVGTVLPGLAVAVSVPLPAQRFYGREAELREALLGWAVGCNRNSAPRSRPRGAAGGSGSARRRARAGQNPGSPR